MTKFRSAALAALLAIGATGAQAAVVTGASTAFGSIPDGDPAGVTRTISIDQDVEIEGINLAIADLSSTWVGDLILRLVSPSGTEVSLIDRPGSGTFGDSSDLDGTYTFDDAAGQDFAASVIPLDGFETLSSGAYRPASPLSAFDGERSAGIWSVFLSDNAFGDTTSAGAATLSIRGIDDGVSPVPLPAGLPLLVAGLGALGFLNRRRG